MYSVPFRKHKRSDKFEAYYYLLVFGNNWIRFGIYFPFPYGLKDFFKRFSSQTTSYCFFPKIHYTIIQQPIVVFISNKRSNNQYLKFSEQDPLKLNCLFTLVAVSDLCDFLGHGPVHAILKSSRKLTNSA